MTAGVGVYGRDIDLQIGGELVAGVRQKSISVNHAVVDVSDDYSLGVRVLMATPGESSLDLSFDGVTKNMEWFRASCATDSSQLYSVVITYPEGTTLTGEFMLTTFSPTGSYNEAETFTMAMQSSGEWTCEDVSP